MTIKEAAKKSGLTLRALYIQIQKGTGYGRHFKRNTAGKWEIDGRLVKKSR